MLINGTSAARRPNVGGGGGASKLSAVPARSAQPAGLYFGVRCRPIKLNRPILSSSSR